jgi:hypothetical protein
VLGASARGIGNEEIAVCGDVVRALEWVVGNCCEVLEGRVPVSGVVCQGMYVCVLWKREWG